MNCPSGQYQSEDGAASCLPCLPGKHEHVDRVNCSKCAIKTYQDEASQPSCKTCATGRKPEIKGSTSCLACLAGLFVNNYDGCSDCSQGRFTNSSDLKSCYSCKVGLYQDQNGKASCLPCIPGEYQDQEGQKTCKPCEKNTKSENPESTKCDNCGIGKSSKERSAICQECQPGKAGTPCEKCEVGMYRGEDDDPSICLKCNTGEASTNGSASCTACDLGRYGSSPGECLDCTPGMYQDGKGESKCIKCPVDTYGTKEKTVSKAECTVCPELRGTNGVTAATSNTSCLCKGSTLYMNDSTSNGYYGGYEGQSCQPCEKGARCDFDGAKLINLTAQTGYWRSSLNSSKFADCSNGYQGLDAIQLSQTRCCPVDPMTGLSICQQNSNRTNYMDEEWSSDIQCQDTYRGTLCLECIEGYVRVGDECNECKGGASLGMAFIAGAGLIIPVFFGVLLNLLCEGKTEHAASIRNKIIAQINILVTFVQILSSMQTTYNGIPWPSAFLSFTMPLSVINLDLVGLFGARFCSMAVSFSYKFIVHMAIPPILAVGILFAYLISRIIKPPKTKELIAHRKAQTFKLLIAMILFMYPGLATRCFQLFKCSKHHGIDYFILEADPSMICYQEEHMLYLTLSSVFIGLYIIGIPLMMFVVLWRNKTHLYVKKGEQPSEEHKEVAFAIGGLYTQCTFEKKGLFDFDFLILLGNFFGHLF